MAEGDDTSSDGEYEDALNGEEQTRSGMVTMAATFGQYIDGLVHILPNAQNVAQVLSMLY